MLREISDSEGIVEWHRSRIVVRPGENIPVDEVTTPRGEATALQWDLVVTNRLGTAMRGMSLRAVVDGYLGTTPVQCSVEESPGVGGQTIMAEMDVTCLAPTATTAVLQIANQRPDDILVTFTGRKRVFPKPILPKIQLTITGLPPGATFQGLGDGIHQLEPDWYWRSPYTDVYGSPTSYSPQYSMTWQTATNSGQEFWRHGTVGASILYNGRLRFSARRYKSDYVRSTVNFYWKYGASSSSFVNTNPGVFYTSSTVSTKQGFLHNAMLTNSYVAPNGATFTWERAPNDPPKLWGYY